MKLKFKKRKNTFNRLCQQKWHAKGKKGKYQISIGRSDLCNDLGYWVESVNADGKIVKDHRLTLKGAKELAQINEYMGF